MFAWIFQLRYSRTMYPFPSIQSHSKFIHSHLAHLHTISLARLFRKNFYRKWNVNQHNSTVTLQLHRIEWVLATILSSAAAASVAVVVNNIPTTDWFHLRSTESKYSRNMLRASFGIWRWVSVCCASVRAKVDILDTLSCENINTNKIQSFRKVVMLWLAFTPILNA